MERVSEGEPGVLREDEELENICVDAGKPGSRRNSGSDAGQVDKNTKSNQRAGTVPEIEELELEENPVIW